MVDKKLREATEQLLLRNFAKADDILNSLVPEELCSNDKILFLCISGITEAIFRDRELGETKAGISRGLAKQSEDNELIGWAELSMGLILSYQGKENEAILFYELARFSFEKGELFGLVAETWLNIAEILLRQGDLKGGQLCIEEAKVFSEKSKDEKFKKFLDARIKLLKGVLFLESGALEHAIREISSSIEIFEDYKAKYFIFEAYSTAGSAYIRMNEYEKALKQLEKALEIRLSKANDINYALALLKIITLLIIKLKRTQFALPFLQELDLLAKESERSVLKGINYHAKGIYELGQLNLYDAEKLFVKAINYYKDFSKIDYLYSLLLLAEVHISKFLIFSNDIDFEFAERALNEVLEIIGEHPLFELKISTLIAKSKLLLVKGDTEKARKLISKALVIAEENNLQILKNLCLKEMEEIQNPLATKGIRIDQALEYVREIARNWQI